MEDAFISRLDQISKEHAELLTQLGSPEVASDHQRYAQLNKKAAELEDGVRAYAEYKAATTEAKEAAELLADAKNAEEREYYQAAVDDARARAEGAEARIREILRPADPRDQRAIIVEVRAGTGGDEAALFAGELMRMYQRFAERRGWQTAVLDATEGTVGGVKEAIFEVDGKGAFSRLRHESGVHRVQRVPATESSGRIHTSTVTVAVLPEADEVDIEIDPQDLRIETFRSGGAGGQHVNTTDSAVRITHIPTGQVASCQNERSQRQNKDRAMKILLARLRAHAEEQAHSQLAAERRSQVGTGERSEKIRTYNFPQNRVTDHRVNKSVHGIQQLMDGDLEDLIEALDELEPDVDDAN